MPKQVNDSVLDSALSFVQTNANKLSVTSQAPASFADANATSRLAEATLTSGDLVVGNGDSSGRKLTVAAKNDLAILAAGTANHVALLDTTNSRVLFVTTCPDQALSTGGTLSVGSWAIEINEPV